MIRLEEKELEKYILEEDCHIAMPFELHRKGGENEIITYSFTEKTAEEFEKITSVDDTCLYYEFLHYMGETLAKEAPVKYSEMVFETRPFQDAEQELLQLLKEWEVRGKTV